MSERYDVLVAGEYYCDLIFGGLSATPRLGDEVFASGLTARPGGAYNMALGLVRLGVRTAWVCDFGTDLFSRLVIEAAAADGISPVAFRHVGASLRQVSVAFASPDERGFITYREADLRAPDRDVLARVRPRWLLQSFRLAPDWLAFIQAAKAAGVKIFGDCNGEVVGLDTAGVRDFIALCDVFSPNEAEALALTGTRRIDDALAALTGIGPAIIIKRGPNGASASFGGTRIDVPAPQVEVVDTVGAGDAFAAGFLSAELAGLPVREQLRWAIAAGSLSTTGAGSSANPSADTLRDFIARSHRAEPHAAPA